MNADSFCRSDAPCVRFLVWLTFLQIRKASLYASPFHLVISFSIEIKLRAIQGNMIKSVEGVCSALAADIPSNTTAFVIDCIMFEEFVIVYPTRPSLFAETCKQEQQWIKLPPYCYTIVKNKEMLHLGNKLGCHEACHALPTSTCQQAHNKSSTIYSTFQTETQI